MKRRLAALFLLCLPLTAAAQQVDVAVFGGPFRALPSRRTIPYFDRCLAPPCPRYIHESRDPGTMVGGRLTVWLGAHFGVEATLQHGLLKHQFTLTETQSGPSLDHFRYVFDATLLAIQPSVRLRIGAVGYGTIAVGPATAFGVSRASVIGYAVSSALRVGIAKGLSVDVRGSHTHLLGAGLEGRRDYLTGGVGLAVALQP